MMRVRRARDTDAPMLAALLSELGYPAQAGSLPHRLAVLAQHGSVVLVAIRDDDVPLGLASVTTIATIHAEAPVGYITALVTARTVRGTGVGRALVHAAESWARAQGCMRLSVTSAEHRADAHAFYPRCGMPYTGRRFSKALS